MNNINHEVGWGNAPADTAQMYIKKCSDFVEDEVAFSKFRDDVDYGKILSGGEYIVGRMALDEISKLGMTGYLNECKDLIYMLDKIGGPKLHTYDEIVSVSPSALRYFSLICQLKKNIIGEKNVDSVIEIGGGFGGFALLFSLIHKPKKYYIVDLPQPLELCKKYLSKYKLIETEFIFIRSDQISSNTHIDNYDLFISDSAFSECSLSVQNNYIDNFANKSSLGAVVWNTFELKNGIHELSNLCNRLYRSSNLLINSQVLNNRGVYIFMNNLNKFKYSNYDTKFKMLELYARKYAGQIKSYFRNKLH